MSEKEPDREFAKLKYVQALEGMRHVQKLEATETGFVIALYGFVIAGLFKLEPGSLERLGFWLLGAMSLVVALIFISHFWRRRKSFYGHGKRLREALASLGGRSDMEEAWAGFLMRTGLIVVLTLALVVVANWRSKARAAEAGILLLGLVAVFLLLWMREEILGLLSRTNVLHWLFEKPYVRPNTRVAITSHGGEESSGAFWEIEDHILCGDVLRVSAEGDARPDHDTPVRIRRPDGHVTETTYGQLRKKVKPGDEVTVGRARSCPVCSKTVGEFDVVCAKCGGDLKAVGTSFNPQA